MADIEVRVVPRAKRNEIGGERDGRLLVRVAAPPVEGRANAAVVKLLSKALGVPRSAVTIARGETSRDKTISVEGVDEGALERLRRGAKGSG